MASDLSPTEQTANERWIECGSTCRDRGHTMQWPYCQRGTDPISMLPPAERAAAEAIRAYQRIPDGGDGYPAIRMGSDWDLAKVALIAARPVIESEVRNAVAVELAASTVTSSTPLSEYRAQVRAEVLRELAAELRAHRRTGGIEYVDADWLEARADQISRGGGGRG